MTNISPVYPGSITPALTLRGVFVTEPLSRIKPACDLGNAICKPVGIVAPLSPPTDVAGSICILLVEYKSNPTLSPPYAGV